MTHHGSYVFVLVGSFLQDIIHSMVVYYFDSGLEVHGIDGVIRYSGPEPYMHIYRFEEDEEFLHNVDFLLTHNYFGLVVWQANLV